MTVGFAGLGIMGSAMAGHLLDAGYALAVWNRTKEKCAGAGKRGAEIAETPAALGKNCAVVHLSLTDTAAVEAVVFGTGGILSAPRESGLIVDHSTIAVPRTRQLAERAAELGWRWVDAPVSGGRAGAEAGRLVVFCGGETEAVEAARATTGCFARSYNHMGPSGAGQAAKMANQLIVGGTFLLLAEAAHLAERNDVEVERLPEVLAGGFADSTLLQQQLPRMIGAREPKHGAAAIMLKDLDLVADLAAKSDAATPLSSLARQLWRLHVAAGHGEEDWVTIIDLLRGAAGTDDKGGTGR